MKKVIFMSILATILLTSPSFAIDMIHGESHDFTIIATIPADPSLSHHRLIIDFISDGLGPLVDEQITATDPLGNYEFMYVYTHTVADHITLGDHSLAATLTSVDQAGNVSEPDTASVSVTIIPSGDITPPDAPTGLEFVE